MRLTCGSRVKGLRAWVQGFSVVFGFQGARLVGLGFQSLQTGLRGGVPGNQQVKTTKTGLHGASGGILCRCVSFTNLVEGICMRVS